MRLPAYAPELNPIEHFWDELRKKLLHNRIFKSLKALEEHLAMALKILKCESNMVASIAS
jgi:transposase